MLKILTISLLLLSACAAKTPASVSSVPVIYDGWSFIQRHWKRSAPVAQKVPEESKLDAALDRLDQSVAKLHSKMRKNHE